MAPRSMYFTLSLAGGRGFGPRFTAPKAAVLPLDDPPKKVRYIKLYQKFVFNLYLY